MEKQYYSILTAQGELDIAQAISDAGTIKIKKIAIGDGNGAIVVPKRTQTKLVNEVYRNTVTSVAADTKNPQNVVVELNIPPDVGGWYIRELGVYNDRDQLIAVGNYPETYKPILASGSGQSLLIRLILKVQSVDNVELTVDSTTVYATRLEVKPKGITENTTNAVDMTGHTHAIDKATTSQAGIVQLTSALDSDSETLSLTAKAGKALKALIDAITRNLSNYIPNSKKSNAVNSTSSDTVATSYAAKTAYDKGVEALNLANRKQSPATTLAGYGIKDFVVRHIGIDENLNDIRTAGIYTQSNSTRATLDKNYPETQGGSLEVINPGGLLQRYTCLHNNHVYLRKYNGENTKSWTQWTRIDAIDKLDLYTGGTVNGDVTISAGNKLYARKISSTSNGADYLDYCSTSGHIFYNNSTASNKILTLSNGKVGVIGDLNINSNMLMFNDGMPGGDLSSAKNSINADGIWADDGNNIFHFQFDTAYKTQGRNGKAKLEAADFQIDDTKSFSNIVSAISALLAGNLAGLKSIANLLGQNGNNPLGIRYDLANQNAWWISFGPLYGGLIIQGGSYLGDKPICYATLAITVNKVFAVIPYQVEGGTEVMEAPESIIAWGIEKANNKTQICLLNKKDWSRPSDYQFFIAFCV